jgi:hypothetical protein
MRPWGRGRRGICLDARPLALHFADLVPGRPMRLAWRDVASPGSLFCHQSSLDPFHERSDAVDYRHDTQDTIVAIHQLRAGARILERGIVSAGFGDARCRSLPHDRSQSHDDSHLTLPASARARQPRESSRDQIRVRDSRGSAQSVHGARTNSPSWVRDRKLSFTSASRTATHAGGSRPNSRWACDGVSRRFGASPYSPRTRRRRSPNSVERGMAIRKYLLSASSTACTPRGRSKTCRNAARSTCRVPARTMRERCKGYCAFEHMDSVGSNACVQHETIRAYAPFRRVSFRKAPLPIVLHSWKRDARPTTRSIHRSPSRGPDSSLSYQGRSAAYSSGDSGRTRARYPEVSGWHRS